jgi:hypothetical protein
LSRSAPSGLLDRIPLDNLAELAHVAPRAAQQRAWRDGLTLAALAAGEQTRTRSTSAQ